MFRVLSSVSGSVNVNTLQRKTSGCSTELVDFTGGYSTQLVDNGWLLILLCGALMGFSTLDWRIRGATLSIPSEKKLLWRYGINTY